MPTEALSVETLQAARVIGRADSSSLQRGRSYYYQGRARIENVNRREAHLWVRGTRPKPYKVYVAVNESGAEISCDCAMATDRPSIVCKHKIAAVLTLQDYLRFHPPVTWESLFDKVLHETPKRTSSPSQLLIFSLQPRSNGWAIYPYSLSSSSLPKEALEHPEDHVTVARLIHESDLSAQAKPIRTVSENKRFLNAPREAQLVARLAAMMQNNYYYYSERPNCGAFLPLLGDSILFEGSEDSPLEQPLRISPEAASPEIEIRSGEAGLLLSTSVILEGRVFPMDPQNTFLLAENPIWLLSGDQVFSLQDSGGGIRPFLETPEIEVPKEDEALFLDRYLLPLAERFPIRGEGISWIDVETDPIPRLYLTEEEGALSAEYRLGYGDYELSYDDRGLETSLQRLPESFEFVRVHRQPEREKRWWKDLSGFGLKRGAAPGLFELRANVHPLDFLFKHIPRLTEEGFEIYGEQNLKSARVNRHRPSLSLNVSSGIDWFDVEAAVNFGEIEVSLKEIRRALRKRERYIKLADGSIGELPDEWIEKYRHLLAFGEETDEGFRLGNHHLELLDQLLSDADRAKTDAEFQRRREKLRGFSNIEPRELPRGFVGELRHYQKSGYDWLHFLHQYEFGGCLADDMGIGKTIQTLVFLLSLKERGDAEKSSLIVLPRSLLFNWQREAEKFTPSLRLLLYSDADRSRDPSEFDQYDLVLTTYGILLRDIETLKEYPFHYAILDESQAIKNPLAKTSKAARLLRADHRLVLTGTPVENSTTELWSQFAFLNPGLLGSFDYFKEEFGAAIEKRQEEDAAQFLRKMVYPFILRRTKAQVAPELPPRTERILYSDMEPSQRKLYNKTRDYYRAMLLGIIEKEGMNDARMKVLEGLLRLRQISNHPRLVEESFKGESGKFELLLENLETLRSEGHKALVFSQFVQMLKLVRESLDRRKIPYVYLDGQTKDRQERVDQFQNDPDIPFFLISLKAGGVGLNLTAADYVIHIDPWWNPAVEMQATDRTHRIGQEKPVFVYKLIAKDSVEEKILQLQEKKKALVEQIISTESSFFKSLTQEDVRNLFE
jgi:non-specific serine/threonine protein kinase